MTMDRVLEGVDASRRAAWAQKYAADERVAELEEQIAQLQATVDACTCWRQRRDEQADGRVLAILSDGLARSKNAICAAAGMHRAATWETVNRLIARGDIVSVGKSSAGHALYISVARSA